MPAENGREPFRVQFHEHLGRCQTLSFSVIQARFHQGRHVRRNEARIEEIPQLRRRSARKQVDRRRPHVPVVRPDFRVDGRKDLLNAIKLTGDRRLRMGVTRNHAVLYRVEVTHEVCELHGLRADDQQRERERHTHHASKLARHSSLRSRISMRRLIGESGSFGVFSL